MRRIASPGDSNSLRRSDDLSHRHFIASERAGLV